MVSHSHTRHSSSSLSSRHHSSHSSRNRSRSPRRRSRSPRRHHEKDRDYNRSSKHESQSKRQREPSPTKAEEIAKKLKLDEEQDFKEKVEFQIEQKQEPSEEELLERSRLRRLAILSKYKSNEQETKPQTVEKLEKVDTSTSSPEGSPKPQEVTTPQPSNSNHALDIFGDSPKSLSSPVALQATSENFDMFSESPSLLPSPTRREGGFIDGLGPIASEIQSDSEGYCVVRAGELLGGRYLVGQSCGQGMFSRVLRAKDLQDNSKEVVVKVIRDNDFMKKTGAKEVEFLQKITDNDPEGKYCCIRLMSSFKDRDFLCLVFEAMACNLRELVNKYGVGVGLHIKAVQVFARKLLLSLHYLKKLELIHADIKPDNILINDKKTSIRLGDLGSAFSIQEAQTLVGCTLVSGYYRAPEIILGLPFDYQIDIWSVACTIYEMVTGNFLFKGSSNSDMIRYHIEAAGEIPRRLIKKSPFRTQHFDDQFNFCMRKTDPVTGKEYIQPISLTQSTRDLKQELLEHATEDEKKNMVVLHDLLSKMLVLDPAKRIQVEEALQHPFFSLKL